MKLTVENGETEDKVLVFRLRTQSDGSIVLEEANGGWSILGLNVVDGKVKFVRYRGVDDENYNTNEDGQIEEVDE